MWKITNQSRSKEARWNTSRPEFFMLTNDERELLNQIDIVIKGKRFMHGVTTPITDKEYKHMRPFLLFYERWKMIKMEHITEENKPCGKSQTLLKTEDMKASEELPLNW